jgi:hypothetical protein
MRANQHKNLLPRRGSFLFIAYAAMMVILALVQLGLGSDVIVDGVFLAIALTPLLIVDYDNLWASDMMMISISMYMGGLSLLFKTAMLQPLQQNLVDPDWSAAYLLAGFMSIVAGFFVVRWIVRRPYAFREKFVSPFNGEALLRMTARGSFIVGLVTQVLQAITQPRLTNGVMEATAGFGGFGQFYFMLLLGLSAQVALLTKFRTNVFERYLLLFMTGGIIAISLVLNVKKPIFDMITVFLLSIYAYRITIRPMHVAAIAGTLVFTVGVASPLIHIARYQGAASASQRIDTTIRILEQNDYDLGKLNKITSHQFTTYSNYREGESYYYPSTENLDRFSLILPTDQVVRTHSPGRLELLEQLGLAVRWIAPSFVLSHVSYNGADEIAWHYGIRNWGILGRPVIGVVASSYGVGGAWAVALLPALAFGMLFAELDLFFGQLKDNTLAVAAASLVLQFAEKEVDQLLVITWREVLFMGLAIWSLGHLYGVYRHVAERPIARGARGARGARRRYAR